LIRVGFARGALDAASHYRSAIQKWQKRDGQGYGGNRILRARNNAVAGSRQILRINSRIISSPCG
jgi:hypothetical protein